MTTLGGKVAIVTGASSGIGRATAILFAKEGAKVIVTARRKPELDTLVAEIQEFGGDALAIAGDVKDELLAKKLVDTAQKRFGGLDVAFNNAGSTGETKPAAEMSRDAWEDVLETNLTSSFLGAKYQIPAMLARGGGSLIFTSSFVGYTAGLPGTSAYAAAKAGQIGLVKALAAELGPKGIRVNAVLPGATDTPANIANAPGAGPEVLAFVEGLHALKRMAKPEEIARAVLWLATEASSFVTGTACLIDGGVSISRT
jgi:NAD(P)-dependent dehydrogenase (short-subunit alcohol dehydrogenase family)